MKDRLDKEKQLDKIAYLLKSPSIDGAAKYHVFEALFKSRVLYGLNVIALYDKKVWQWLKRFMYHASRKLLGITNYSNKEKTLNLVLGEDFNDF